MLFLGPDPMIVVVAWVGFLGAWCLFLGPVYQAALELRSERIARGVIEKARSVSPPPRISRLWWIVPPLHMLFEFRRTRAWRDAQMNAMTLEELTAILTYMQKAGAWLTVGAGGFLVAVQQTFQLCRVQGWSDLVFGLVTLGMTVATAGMCVSRLHRADFEIERKRATKGGDQATAP